ncbi:inner membrane CreD family protein, partial [Streptococcus mitis]|uniref:inner membrane CreD family protein n=1 Tax=Streptococcus mitis TaxID=28037 RepID=UPI0021B7B186
PEDVLWEKASIVVRTTNLKSIKSDLNIKLNSQSFLFESKNIAYKIYGELETNLFNYSNVSANYILNFDFSISYNGSNSVK